MASNFFGQLFRFTTFGESHGPGIGVVIDGCPAGIALTLEDIQTELDKRRPGKNRFTSPRKETDVAEILSGVFEGLTTGAPLTLFIRNVDADSSSYEPLKTLYRPGHANYTYLAKYGHFDYRGGGRSSGRETASRVAAGAVAKKWLAQMGISCTAYISEIGGIAMEEVSEWSQDLREKTVASPIFCPCAQTEEKILAAITQVQEERDSFGGIVTCVAHAPAGLGDPVYGKLEALLASAMLSIPASKGFEIGQGFQAARMRGSEHNDPFDLDAEGRAVPATNQAGGTLGGISTGCPIVFRVAFKPTSSIKRPQATVSLQGERTTFQLQEKSRHDPCLAIRAVPAVEAMAALVLADAVLMQRVVKA